MWTQGKGNRPFFPVSDVHSCGHTRDFPTVRGFVLGQAWLKGAFLWENSNPDSESKEGFFFVS